MEIHPKSLIAWRNTRVLVSKKPACVFNELIKNHLFFYFYFIFLSKGRAQEAILTSQEEYLPTQLIKTLFIPLLYEYFTFGITAFIFQNYDTFFLPRQIKNII